MTDRVLEIGEAGLESTDQKVKKLMDNMVNAQVPGYKKSDAVISSFPLELEAAEQRLSSQKPRVEGTFYNFLAGALIKTDNKLDVALGSPGFFILYGPWGEGYSRDGRFRLDKDGRLISVAGNFPVLGKGGPIVVTPGAEVEITQDGEVKVDGTTVDTLRVVQPERTEDLEAIAGGLFRKKNPNAVMTELDTPRVIQGYIEASNVNIVDQMMEMIYLERIYGINAKMIQARDGALSKAMELGKPTQ